MQMTDDLARVILLVGFALVVPVGIYHRVRSHTDERLDRRQEGWLILLTLRPLALAFMAGFVAFLIEPRWMEWASFLLPNWARWSGAGLGVATGGLLIWTFLCPGHNLTDTVVTRRNTTLVTHGPYRWVRHPFCLAFATALVGPPPAGPRGGAGAVMLGYGLKFWPNWKASTACSDPPVLLARARSVPQSRYHCGIPPCRLTDRFCLAYMMRRLRSLANPRASLYSSMRSSDRPKIRASRLANCWGVS